MSLMKTGTVITEMYSLEVVLEKLKKLQSKETLFEINCYVIKNGTLSDLPWVTKYFLGF